MQARTRSIDFQTYIKNTLLDITRTLAIPVGIVDDQQLFLKSLGTLINTIDGFNVIVEALNGADLLKKLSLQTALPNIVLLDVNMPVIDGVATESSIVSVVLSRSLAAGLPIILFFSGL